jgi:capsular polysaccharide biosynthesis protein
VNNGDRTAALDLRERLWAYEDFTAEQEHPGLDVTGAFASLGFLREALRRNARLWLALAVIGLILGAGMYAALPPKYQATTSIYFTNNPDMDALDQIDTNQTLVSTPTVAEQAMGELRVGGTVASFLGSYTAAPVTDEVMSITASASTSAQAVTRAQTIAETFLSFRANMLRSELAQEDQTLNLEVTAAQQKVDSLTKQISQLTSSGSSGTSGSSGSTDHTELTTLTRQRTSAEASLTALQTTVQAADDDNAVTTAAMINGTEIINPATALAHSKLKYLAFYIAIGLFGGLAIGMGFIVIRALVTDRFRRRRDIASALGMPVKLSTGPVRGGWVRDKGASANVRRLVGYLRSAIPSGGNAPAALAVVAVDNARDVADLVAELVRACAGEGQKVAVADLIPGAPAARLLGMRGTGVHHLSVSSPGAPVSPLVVIVPERDDVAPGGPLRRSGVAVRPADPDLAATCRSSDVLITLLTLEPGTGGEHLPTWATDVVVAATAGRSSGPRLYAVGELVRLAHPRSVSAVLINADRADQSLGVPETPGQPMLTMPG